MKINPITTIQRVFHRKPNCINKIGKFDSNLKRVFEANEDIINAAAAEKKVKLTITQHNGGVLINGGPITCVISADIIRNMKENTNENVSRFLKKCLDIIGANHIAKTQSLQKGLENIR